MYGLYPGDKQHKNKKNYKRGLKINVNRTKTLGRRGPNFYLKRLRKHLKKHRGKKTRRLIKPGIFQKFRKARYLWEKKPGKLNKQWLGVNYKRKKVKIYNMYTKRKDHKMWSLHLGFKKKRLHELRFKRDHWLTNYFRREKRERWKKRRTEKYRD